MIGTNFRISGDLTHTDNVMNNTFWIGVQPALTTEMLEFAAKQVSVAQGKKIITAVLNWQLSLDCFSTRADFYQNETCL